LPYQELDAKNIFFFNLIYKHCEYQSLLYVQVVPATQHFGPDQPMPPHCEYLALQVLGLGVGVGTGAGLGVGGLVIYTHCWQSHKLDGVGVGTGTGTGTGVGTGLGAGVGLGDADNGFS
jgi:hypothetical protein